MLVQRPSLTAAVVQRLTDRGIVHVGDDGKGTRQVQVMGSGRHRYVCFNEAALKAAAK